MREKPEPDFTIEEIARELAGALGIPTASDPGATSVELAQAWGVGKTTANRRLRKLQEEGRVIVGTRVKGNKRTLVYRPKNEEG